MSWNHKHSFVAHLELRGGHSVLSAVAERNNMSVWEAAMGEWWTLMDWRHGDCFKGLQRAIHRAHRVHSALHCDVRPYQWLGVPHLDYPDRVRGAARLVYLGGSLQFDRGTGRCKHRKELRKLFE